MTGRSLWQIYLGPLLMAIVTIAALAVGLLADGTPDLVAVMALATIPALCAWKFIRG